MSLLSFSKAALSILGITAIGSAAVLPAEAAVFRGTPATDGSPYVFLVDESGTYQRTADTAAKTITPPKCGFQRIKLALADTSFKLNGVDTAISSLPEADFQCKLIGGADTRFKSVGATAPSGFPAAVGALLPNDKRAMLFIGTPDIKADITLDAPIKVVEKTLTANACGQVFFKVPTAVRKNSDQVKYNLPIFSMTLNGAAANIPQTALAAKPTCKDGVSDAPNGGSYTVTTATGTSTYYAWGGLTPGAAVPFTATTAAQVSPKGNACGIMKIGETASRTFPASVQAIVNNGSSHNFSSFTSDNAAYCAKVGGVARFFTKG